MKQIIDNQKKLIPKNYQNSYYRRRNSYNCGNSNYSNQNGISDCGSNSQNISNPFKFVFGGILSKPETITNLHTPKTIVVEKDVVALVETESFKIRPGGTEGRGGGYSQKGPIKDIFASVECSRSRLSCKKRSNVDLHEQRSSREILERKYTVQRIPREWTRSH
jgi:hypothetical protein